MQRMVFDWPAALRPSSLEFWLEHHTGAMVNPYTRQRQVIELPGARWRCTISLDNLRGERAGLMDATLARLRGGVHMVRLYDARRPAPRRFLPLGWSYGGSSCFAEWFVPGRYTFADEARFNDALAADGQYVSVNGANQLGAYLSTRGWQPSMPVLSAGDYIGLDDWLYMLTEDAISDGAGHALLTIAPDLLAGVQVADGQPLRFGRPVARFALDNDAQPRNPTRWPGFSSYTLGFTQVLEFD